MPAPSLGQFLEAARSQNPGVSDESLTQYWRSNYAGEAPRDASLPSQEHFLHVAKGANPDTPEDALKAYWQKEYGDRGAPEKETKRGLVAEVGMQLKAGAALDIPKMIASAMQWMGGDSAIGSIGESEKIRAEKYGEQHPEFANQIDEKDGIIRRALSRGARAIPASAALIGPTVAAAPLGAIAGTAVAGAGAFGLFGASQAQETYDKLKEAGVSDEDATRAGYINMLIEGAGETVGTYFGGKLLNVGAKAIGGKTSVAAAIEAATDSAVWKPFAKQLGETAAIETATEFGQNYGETAVEKAYGSKEDTTPLKQGIEGAEAALGMTALLAPFGLGGAVRRARSNAKVAAALTDPSVNPIDRIAASKVVYDDIASVSPEAAKAWAENSAVAISDKAPISLDESSAQPAKTPSGVQDILQASNVDDAVTAALNAVKTPQEIQNQIAGETNEHNAKAAQVEAAYAQKHSVDALVREAQTNAAERQRAEEHMEPANKPYEMSAADHSELRERLRGIAAEQRTRAQRQAADEPTAPLAEKLLNARRVGETQAQYEARTGGANAVQEQGAGEGRVQRSAGAGNEIPGEGVGGGNAQPVQAAGTRAAGDRGAASRQEAVAGVREGEVPRGASPESAAGTKTSAETPSNARIFGKPVGDLTDAELRLAATNHRMSAHREVAQAEIARRQGATAAQAAPAAETPAPRTYTPEEGAQELGRQLGVDVEHVDHKEAPATARMAARVVSKAFGKKVVFMRSGEAGFDSNGRAKWNTDGAVLPDDPSTIYVNLNSNRKWQAVIGHETLHALRRTNEKVYTQLRDAVNSAIDDGAFAWAGKAYAERTKDVQNEEIVANVFGDQMHEPRFWLEVYQHTKDAKALANAAFSTLDKIRSKFATDGRVGNYSAEFVTDAKRVRSAAARAYAQWQKGAESRARLTGGALESKPDEAHLAAYREATVKYKGYEKQVKALREELAKLEKRSVDETDPEMESRMNELVEQIASIEREAKPAKEAMLAARAKAYPPLQSKPATQTPEFKKWFGESKVVDAQGQPREMYHGTSKDKDFKSFRVSQRGAFFTSDAKEASDYAADNDTMNTMSAIGTQKNRASRVMPVYLSIKNPYVMNEREKVAYASVSSYRKFQSELRNRAIVAGHDGIKFSDDTYVVFKPEQIKSAIGNRGTFDAAKSNILESKPADASLIPYLYGGRTPEQFSTMHDLGKFFDERVKKLYGRALDITKPNDRSIVTRSLVREARAALEQQDNARGWFRKDVDDAMKAASLVHKEIADDPNHRFAFSVALAITSNGTAVAENVRNAFDAYEKFSKTGKMPSAGYGVRAAAMAKSFATFNTLVKEMGLDGAREALLTKHPAWLLKRAGYEIRELSREEVYGGSIFGPKIGGAFLPNLNGQYDVPAMDRWFMRTFGRLSGNLASKASETGLRDSPPNPEFRSAARGVLDDVIAKLDVKGMQQSDLQALLWYPEKDLYSMMGVADDSAAPTSYNQEVMNYAREKLKLSAEQLERSLRGVQAGTGRRAGDGETRGGEEARANDIGRGNKTAGESSANPIASASAAIAKDESTPRDKSRLGRCHYLVFQKLLENDTLKQVIGVVSTWPSAKQKVDGNFKVFIWHSVAFDPKSKNFWEPITNLWYTRAAMRAFGFEPVAALTSEKALALAMKTRMAVSQQQYSENIAPLRGWETDHLLPGDFDSDWKVLQSKPEDAAGANDDLDFTNVEPPASARSPRQVDEHESKVRYTMSRRGSSPRVDWEMRPQSGTWISGTADGRYRIEPESGGYTSYAGDDIIRWDRSRQGAIATVNDRYLEDIAEGEVRDPLAHKSLLRRYKADQIERVVGGLKRLAEVEGIFRTGTSKSKKLVDVIHDVDTKKVVKQVHPTQFDLGEGIVYSIVFQNGKPAFVHEDDEEKVAWVDAASLDKGSQLGSFLYPAVFQWVKNAGLKLIPDPAGLSLVNTYRRTEQMLSAALKLGSTEFESPHPDQRLFGWNEDPRTQEDNDKNIAIMALTSMDNTFSKVPQAEEYRFNFETNKFEDGDENEVGAKELDALIAKNDKAARSASIGRTTLARAIFINTFLQDHPGAAELAEGEVPNTLAAGLMREPEEGKTLALYSKPAEAKLESKPAYIGNSKVANEAARKAGLYRPEKSFVERVKEMVPTFVKRMEQGLVDQFAPIKELDYLSYMLARMSKATDGSVEAMFLYGKPYLESGALNVSMKDGGLTKVLQRLNGEHDRFIAWIAGNRAAQLKTEGRERLFDDAEIDWLKNLNQGQMKDGKSRAALYAEVHKEFNAYSKAVLDIAEQQGIIDPESRAVWEKDFYVPFYRNMDDEVSGPTIKSGLVSQQAFKRLKGGEQELNDLLANTLMNWSHLLSAAMKNKAALSTMEAAVAAGGAIEVPSEYAGKQMQIGKVMKALDGGRERYFVLEDPFLIDAISSLEAMSFGPVAKLFGTVKRWLTVGVTANPSFKVRNLIRDSISSIGVAELPYNPISNIAGAWADTAHSSQLRASALASGAIIRFGTQLEGSRAEYVRDLVNEGIDPDTILDKEHKVVSMLKLAWDRYQEYGDRGENVNRIALYKQLRAQGQSHLQASYAARDLLDFSKQGTWRAVRFLVQTVPFFNARVQGLAKLGQGWKENPKRMGYVLGAVAVASVLLMLAYKDDDDWKKREDWDRDNFWWFKIGNTAFRIPKPFEIGAMGSFAERLFELGASDEMTGKRFAQRVGSLLMDNLSMNPTPQLVKPMIELYANKDFFQGKPIETQGMQELSKAERIGRNTSAAAQIAGKAGVLSPVQIDHVIRSYFGWLGTSATTILEYGLRPMMGLPERPASSLKDAFIVGNFVESLPTNTSRYITDFYNSSVEIKQAYADWNQAMLTHQSDKAKELRAENKDAIALHGVVGSVERRLSVLNRLEKIVLANKDMTPDEKRARLDKLDAQKGEIAKNYASLVAKRRAAKEAVAQ